MSKKSWNTPLILLAVIVGGFFAYQQGWFTPQPTPTPSPTLTPTPGLPLFEVELMTGYDDDLAYLDSQGITRLGKVIETPRYGVWIEAWADGVWIERWADTTLDRWIVQCPEEQAIEISISNHVEWIAPAISETTYEGGIVG